MLHSEFLNEPRDHLEEREAVIKLTEGIEEQEVLLEFLLQVQQRKRVAADKLQEALSCLSSDIGEVMEQQMIFNKKGGSFLELKRDELSVFDKVDSPSKFLARKGSASLGLGKRIRQGHDPHPVEDWSEHLDESQKSETRSGNQVFSKGSRLMKNFKKLESAYFSMRCNPSKPTEKRLTGSSPINSTGGGSLVINEGSSVDNLVSKAGYNEGKGSRWINPFLEGLCKYLSFSNLKVRADLKQGDLLNSPSLVCSLNFDRDRELFATAGVSKKIKIFECDMILNENRDIHYPVAELSSRSKLSCICWNGYIKNQIVSSDFDGVVQVGCFFLLVFDWNALNLLVTP